MGVALIIAYSSVDEIAGCALIDACGGCIPFLDEITRMSGGPFSYDGSSYFKTLEQAHGLSVGASRCSAFKFYYRGSQYRCSNARDFGCLSHKFWCSKGLRSLKQAKSGEPMAKLGLLSHHTLSDKFGKGRGSTEGC